MGPTDNLLDMLHILLALLTTFAHADSPPEETKCPPDNQFKFSSVEQKLNLDGQKPLDAIARYEADENDHQFYRRALLPNAPTKPEDATPTLWLEPCREGGENPDVTISSFEKVSVGSSDLLLTKEEGAGSVEARFQSLKDGALKTHLSFKHPNADGQFNEKHTSKRLTVKITGDGELNVNGEAVDLEGMSIKARCRVRELFIQVEYEWDRKAQAFKEISQSCVMGVAID